MSKQRTKIYEKLQADTYIGKRFINSLLSVENSAIWIFL